MFAPVFAHAFSRANPTPLSLSLSLNEVKRQQESDRGGSQPPKLRRCPGKNLRRRSLHRQKGAHP